MKIIHSLLLAALVASLASCSSPADNTRASALADLAIAYATAAGKITPADAALIREAKTIVLPGPTATAVETPGKQPLPNLTPKS